MFCNLTQAKNQISTPTWARTLAQATAQIIAQGRGEPVDYIREKRGLYHLTDGGFCSRYEWAKTILTVSNNTQESQTKSVIPVNSNYFTTTAKRPRFSAQNCNKLYKGFFLIITNWKETLQLAFSNNSK
jgi:dTDP-4-dehydrorhamnose reductase